MVFSACVDATTHRSLHNQLHGVPPSAVGDVWIALYGVGPYVRQRADRRVLTSCRERDGRERNSISRQIQAKAGFKAAILIQLRNALLCGSLSTDSAAPTFLRSIHLGLAVCVSFHPWNT